MTTRKLTQKDLRERFLNETNTDGSFSSEDLSKSEYDELLTMPADRRHERIKEIRQKILEDITNTNVKAIVDTKLRTKIKERTSLAPTLRCKVCSSIYYTIYMEWLTMDNKSIAECARLAEVCFEEYISESTFRNHHKHHLKDAAFIRKAIVMQDPDIDPNKVARGMIQLLRDEILQDETINLRKAKTLERYLLLSDKMEKQEKPVIDNSTTNITQINQGVIPNSKEADREIKALMTPEEKERLSELQKKWENKGSGRLRSLIPEKPPIVEKDSNAVIDAVYKDIDDD